MSRVSPMQPVTGALPVGPEWTYEVDWAGMRLMADIVEGHLSLLTEDEDDVTARFPEFAGLHEAIADGLLDGEAVMLDGGSPSATALEERLSAGDAHTARGLARRRPAVFMVYDILRLYGVPLTPRPLDERRAVLGRLDLSAATRIQISPPYEDGPALLSGVREQGLAGIVAKRRTGTYRAGDSGGDWIRVSAETPGRPARHAHDHRSRRHRGGSAPDIPDLDALAGGLRRAQEAGEPAADPEARPVQGTLWDAPTPPARPRRGSPRPPGSR